MTGKTSSDLGLFKKKKKKKKSRNNWSSQIIIFLRIKEFSYTEVRRSDVTLLLYKYKKPKN